MTTDHDRLVEALRHRRDEARRQHELLVARLRESTAPTPTQHRHVAGSEIAVGLAEDELTRVEGAEDE